MLARQRHLTIIAGFYYRPTFGKGQIRKSLPGKNESSSSFHCSVEVFAQTGNHSRKGGEASPKGD